MSLLYLDSFDNYAADADLNTRWTRVGGAFNYVTTGRSGSGKALSILAEGRLERGLDSNEQTIFVGFAYNPPAPAGVGGTNWVQLLDGGTIQCSLGLIPGTLQPAFKLGATTIIDSSARFFRVNKWYYIEAKFTVSNTLGVGDLELRVNGETWLTIDSGDSQTTANAYADGFSFGSASSSNLGVNALYDDFYILNDSGSAPYNTFLGDIRVDTIRPDGNGATSDFVGSDANSTDNYLLVDEADPDGDTTYIESGTATDIDLHTLESLAVTPDTIFGVQPVSIARKTDAGARTGRHVLRTGATNYESADFNPANGSYLGFAEIWEENPNTTSPWIEADVNGLESGIKVET